MKNITYYLFSIVFLFSACTYVQKIQDGKMAIDRKQYDVAIDLLDKEYKKSKSRVEKGKIAFLLGEAYKQTGKGEKSIQWYETAYNNQFGTEALKEYAYALKRNQQYVEAKQAFKDLGLEIGSPYEYRKDIAACKIAQEWQENPNKEYKVSSTEFNSNQSDYAPTPYADNSLVFTSDRKNATGEDTYNWTGAGFSDLFIVDLKTEEVRPFDIQLNTESNEGTAVFSPNFKEIYFTRCFDPGKNEDNYCKIMFSRQEGDNWSTPVMMNFTMRDINYRHPALSPDGKILYFSSDDPDGWGGYDLYYATRESDGWSEPKLLPRTINTVKGNEGFPYIDRDTMYFATDGHTGMGGLDIFKTVRREDATWMPVTNLKAPINSSRDDFGYIVDYQAAKNKEELLAIGYFSSSRAGSGDDIYKYEKVILPPEPEPEVPEVPVVIEYRNVLEGYVLEKIYAAPDSPNSNVLGRKPLNNARVTVNFGKEKLSFTTGEDGFFTFDLNDNTDYSFFASREGYLNNTDFFSSKGIGQDPDNPVQTFETEIVLDKIYLNQEITLENIYYDLDDDKIREDAQPTLRDLAANLNLNPDLRIQMASHTDCRGGDDYNQNLSQRRAQSAVNYLISLGIEPDRLQAKGYGESKPAADCVCSRCSEEEHQRNRRTTFAIVE